MWVPITTNLFFKSLLISCHLVFTHFPVDLEANEQMLTQDQDRNAKTTVLG